MSNADDIVKVAEVVSDEIINAICESEDGSKIMKDPKIKLIGDGKFNIRLITNNYCLSGLCIYYSCLWLLYNKNP
jgi:hypothetical protein